MMRAISCALPGVAPRRLASALGRRSITLALVASLAASPAMAHLALIRQGSDGAGALEAGDRTGSALAFGDFNGDGYADLAIGAPDETEGPNTDAGAVVVHYGSALGLTHVGAVSRTAASVGGSAQSGALFGAALATGDFDGDGDDDLAIGAPGEDIGPNADAGRVYVLSGAPAGLGTAATIVLVQGGAGVVEPGDRFGEALAAGDLDGNAYADLVVGSPGEDAAAGAVAAYYGTASGLGPAGASFLRLGPLGITASPGDRFGAALAIGQLTGGTASPRDLIAGAPGRDVFPALNAGMVVVVPGSASGLTLAATSYTAATLAGGLAQSDGALGRALACGRFSSAGHDWAAIGEPGRDVTSAGGAGRVLVVPGTAAGLDAGGTSILDGSLVTGATGIEAGDAFGSALATGHWNADGLDDLAIGTPLENLGDPEAGSAGAVDVVPGAAAGLDAALAEVLLQGMIDADVQAGAQFGSALAFGACDASGRMALAAGAPRQDEDADWTDALPAVADAGAVYVFAPWRQVLRASDELIDGPGLHAHLAVTNAEDSLVYSRRAFDRTYPAGTSRVMTALLAAESGLLATTYTVPSWVETELPGTLVAGQTLTIGGLLRKCLVSADQDAACALADALTGGANPPLDLCMFVGQMNARAALLGMASTQFANPDGPEHHAWNCGPHFTTARDMARLARAAMGNAQFENVSGAEDAYATRFIGDTPVAEHLVNNWLRHLHARLPTAGGVQAGRSGGDAYGELVTADTLGQRVVVAGYDRDRRDYEDPADLLVLGFAQSASAPVPVRFHPPEYSTYMLDATSDTTGVYLDGGTLLVEGPGPGGESRAVLSAQAARPALPDTMIAFVRRFSGTDTARVWLDASLLLEGALAPGDTCITLYAPARPAVGTGSIVRVHSLDTLTAHLRLERTGLPDTTFALPPGASMTFTRPSAGASLTPVWHRLINTGNLPALLAWEEVRCGWTFLLGAMGTDTSRVTITRERRGPLQPMTAALAVRLRAAVGDSLEYGFAPPALAAIVGAPPRAPAGVTGPRVLWLGPNPVRDRVRFAVSVVGTGGQQAVIHDVAGRAVRTWRLGPGDPGVREIEWDGRDAGGRWAGPGVYFLHVRERGAAVGPGVKFVRVR